MPQTMREHALEYARRGWSVIPLRYQGSAEDLKRPLVDSWEECKTEPSGTDVIEYWWEQWPLANIGLVMGAVSGMVAIDLDGPNAMKLLTDRIGTFRPTRSVKTGKGKHLLFRHPGRPIKNRVKLLSGADSAVDVRSDGGYIVAPPSRHGNGSTYEWINPEEIISDIPPALMELLETQGTAGRGLTADDHRWITSVMDGVESGGRNDAASRLAGYWLAVTKGNEDAAWMALRAWNRMNTPPLPEDELSKTFRSIAQRDRVDPNDPRMQAMVLSGAEWAEELANYRPRQGVKLGMPGIDDVGGLVPGDAVVVAGRPGMGKSTYAFQAAVNAAIGHKLPTLIISTEMTRGQVGHWMASYYTKTPTRDLAYPMPDELLKLWRDSPIHIADQGSVNMTAIREAAEKIMGIKLVIVDHIGRIVSSRREMRTLEVGETARSLKSLAKDLKCTVIELCQLNRASEIENRHPRLADLRESGEIEAECDAAAFLWVPEAGSQKLARCPMQLSIEKNRHGELKDIDILFEKELRYFRDYGDGRPE